MMVSRMRNDVHKHDTCTFKGVVQRGDGAEVPFYIPNLDMDIMKGTIKFLHTKVEERSNNGTWGRTDSLSAVDKMIANAYENNKKKPSDNIIIDSKYNVISFDIIDNDIKKYFYDKKYDSHDVKCHRLQDKPIRGVVAPTNNHVGKNNQNKTERDAVRGKEATNHQQEADMSGNITKTELEALLRANKSEVDVVAANIQKEMAEWREQQNAQMTEVNKTLSILNVKMDERFENQKQSSTRIQWMVGVAIAAAALVPAYFGMVKSEPAPMQQPTIVYVQQPAPAVQATQPQVQPAPQPVPQEPTPEPQKAPATKQ